jgi:signal transduction histidine kinase
MEKREAGLTANARSPPRSPPASTPRASPTRCCPPSPPSPTPACGLVYRPRRQDLAPAAPGGLRPRRRGPGGGLRRPRLRPGPARAHPLLRARAARRGRPGGASSVLAVPLVMHDRRWGSSAWAQGPVHRGGHRLRPGRGPPARAVAAERAAHRDVERLALELQEANDRLQERNAQLEERTAESRTPTPSCGASRGAGGAGPAQDRVLAAVAPRAAQPAAVISSATRLLEEARRQPGGARAGPGVIRRQSSLLSRMVDDLLDAARVGRGQLPWRRPRGPGGARRHAAEAAAPAMRQKNHRSRSSCRRRALDRRRRRAHAAGAGNLLHNAPSTPTPAHVKLQVKRDGDDAVVTGQRRGIGWRPRRWRRPSSCSCRWTAAGRAPRAAWASGWRWCATWWCCTAARGGQERRAGPVGCEFEVRCRRASPPGRSPGAASSPRRRPAR